MKHILKGLSTIINLVLLTSCLTPSPDANALNDTLTTQIDETSEVDANRQLASDVDPLACTLPCWASIVPGVTDRQGAETILQQRYGVDNLEFTTNSIYWTSNSVDNSIGGSLMFFENIVDHIYIAFDKNYLQVTELVDRVETPEAVRLAIAFSSEHRCAGASLFYSKRGIEAWIIPENTMVGVKEEQFIGTIELISPRLLENWELTDSFLVEWSGYRDYCP